MEKTTKTRIFMICTSHQRVFGSSDHE